MNGRFYSLYRIHKGLLLAAGLGASSSLGCTQSDELFPGGGSLVPSDAQAGPDVRQMDADTPGPVDGGAPSTKTVFHAVSLGAHAEQEGLGAAFILRNDALFFWGDGGHQDGARSFSIAVINPSDGTAYEPVRTFDTYYTREDGSESAAMLEFLNGIPDGKLVLIVVADDAGLTYYHDEVDAASDCTPIPDYGGPALVDALEALGSTLIRDYCFRESWAFATITGTGSALDEDLAQAGPARVYVEVP